MKPRYFFAALMLSVTGYATTGHATPSITYSSLTESQFSAALEKSAGYLAFQVGDSLHPASVGGGVEPELLGGSSPTSLSVSSQFDWPVNWVLSTFTLSYQADPGEITLSLLSGDPNSRPSSASVHLPVSSGFDHLYLGGTALAAALYVNPLSLNSEPLPPLSPNAYGFSPDARFSGLQIGGEALQRDFSLTGLIYFDGGTQTGAQNRVEFALMRINEVPSPGTLELLGLGCLMLLLMAGRSSQKVRALVGRNHHDSNRTH